jgi:hypothetical protein
MGKRARGRKAWLVTWEWAGNHAKVPDEDVVAAVLRPQVGSETVRRLVEFLYAQREYAPEDKLAALDHNPYPAMFGRCRFIDSDGTVRSVASAGEVVCGHNPWLRARLVDNLRMALPDAGLDWDERKDPPILDFRLPAERA